MDTKGVGTVGVLVFLGLVAGLIGFAPTYEHNVAVQESQPTTGVVQSTDIDVKTDDDGDESYNPIVVYEYTVDGQSHTQDNTFPGRFTRWRGSHSWAESIVNGYRPGQEVTVHYNPANPGQAYLRNDGWPGSWFFGAGYVLVAVAGGVSLVRTGFRRWNQRQLMANTPTERVRSLSIGRSEIKGTARTGDREPMSAPFSDENCVVAKYEIEEYDEGDDDDPGSWHTIEEGTRHMPFYLDDGSGSVLVEPADDAVFDLDPSDRSTTYVDSSEHGPAPIQQFVRSTSGLDFPANSGGKDNDRKYHQNLIRPDESVYVFGTVRPRDDPKPGATQAERLVVGRDDDAATDGAMFMISDDSETDLTDRRSWTIWHAFAGGAFLVVAFVFLLGIFAPELGLELPVVL